MSSEEEIEILYDDENEPPKKKRKTRSLVWNHFTQLENGAKCVHCNTEIQSLVTTALHRHLHKEHRDILLHQEPINLLPLEERILNWVIFSMIPLHAIDNDAFSKLFLENVSSRQSIKRLMINKFQSEKLKFICSLEKVQSKVSFTTDLWSANFKDFMGITIHYIDENFQLNHNVIAVKRICSHKGKEIATIFLNTLLEFKLLKKIGWITTDNHTNNDTFCEELTTTLRKNKITIDIEQRHVRCLCHIINLVVNDILDTKPLSELSETVQRSRTKRLSGNRKKKKPSS